MRIMDPNWPLIASFIFCEKTTIFFAVDVLISIGGISAGFIVLLVNFIILPEDFCILPKRLTTHSLTPHDVFYVASITFLGIFWADSKNFHEIFKKFSLSADQQENSVFCEFFQIGKLWLKEAQFFLLP